MDRPGEIQNSPKVVFTSSFFSAESDGFRSFMNLQMLILENPFENMFILSRKKNLLLWKSHRMASNEAEPTMGLRRTTARLKR